MVFTDLNLNKPLLNALSDIEYEYPTPIQEQSFSVIMSGRDVVGIAQTGTGKTMAYLLPILRQLEFSQQLNPRILIIVPTRELVIQALSELKKLTTYMSVRACGVYGGANINTQAEEIILGQDVIIGTPGRLYDLRMKGVLSFKAVKKLVIDEVDEMLNLGFKPQIESILEVLPAKRQNILFSATLTQEVEILFSDFFADPEKIEIAPHGTPLEKIKQTGYHVPNFFTKINLLKHLLYTEEGLNKVLVFVGSRKNADILYDKIEPDFKNEIGVIHSNKSQNYRFRAVEDFDKGIYRVLIATDIMARGLDICDVSHVINFNMPESPGDYLHRVGRTGRAQKSGEAISFITEDEQESQMVVEELMNKTIELLPLPEEIIISKQMLPEEETTISSKNYLKMPTLKGSRGAYHEKKEKNKKVNLGGPGRRKPKNKKPSNRSASKKKHRG